MNLEELLKDKLTKSKEKTETLSTWLLNAALKTNDLIEFAKNRKDPDKATCIEALEFATKQQPTLMTTDAFVFVTTTLTAKAPRVKWESAKVIGNTAALFPDQLDESIRNLLDNSEHEGTVVRWSAAYALGEIIKLKTPHNHELIPAVEAICNREEKNSIRKIYLDALKKAAK
ncbi:MAG: hypothetical protein A3D31_04595 [Candidatus Fluviicola riflensis]|nr:MAG: hypothetical protein CHH17_10425 [Candidatus Fluviicola riflensis]OGS79255.1 MAG: hypothetical protein A3D31_04595 [Candidatus Fluviicola riflensis]OGS86687.1 MAG: hypothetical protein A2724_04055 [Fluviicola sp. RIFCSPHIGHO2_01_FULL_43_53]OGS88839.1 MAG: hypothetical protein A3E30_00605 [Fluviicola sp. RIFCSPHIGHO2_12_FULL_43_24]